MVKNLPANAGDKRYAALIPGLRRSPGRGNGNTLQDSCLENSMDRGAWWAAVHGGHKRIRHNGSNLARMYTAFSIKFTKVQEYFKGKEFEEHI